MDKQAIEKLRQALSRAESLGYREDDLARLRQMLRAEGLWDDQEPLLEEDAHASVMFLRRDVARMSLQPYDLHSWRETIDFMRDVWNDDLENILVRLNRVSLSSAKSWIRGKEASPRNRMRTQGFAREVYKLRYQDHFLFRDILIWAEDPPGNSPIECWRDMEL